MFQRNETPASVRRLVRLGYTVLVCGAERSAVIFGRQDPGSTSEAIS
jgi:hypothetical protein